jgi:hypothetical protein
MPTYVLNDLSEFLWPCGSRCPWLSMRAMLTRAELRAAGERCPEQRAGDFRSNTIQFIHNAIMAMRLAIASPGLGLQVHTTTGRGRRRCLSLRGLSYQRHPALVHDEPHVTALPRGLLLRLDQQRKAVGDSGPHDAAALRACACMRACDSRARLDRPRRTLSDTVQPSWSNGSNASFKKWSSCTRAGAAWRHGAGVAVTVVAAAAAAAHGPYHFRAPQQLANAACPELSARGDCGSVRAHPPQRRFAPCAPARAARSSARPAS